MSCIRNGVRYKRHKMDGDKCVKCGSIRVPSEEYDKALSKVVNDAIRAQQNG